MNANAVLIDLLEDNRRRLKRLVAGMSDDCLQWKPEAEANSIAITIWHMARILDVFLTQQAKGEPPADECWFRGGWAAQTRYDPRGRGLNGWGMLTGFTQEEVDAIPPMSREQTLGYLDQVYDITREYLAATPEEILQTPALGFEGKYSRYQCIQMPLMDNVRHLGEVYSIAAGWERRNHDNNPIFLIVGGPAVGKSTTSRTLAARFPRSVHIPVDDLRMMVVAGLAQPGAVWGEALVEQLRLARENAANMALRYREAGFAVVIDDFWDPFSHLSEYLPLFREPAVIKVLLYPSQETAHARNRARADSDSTQAYLDEGIRLTYDSLRSALPELETAGWLVVDKSEEGVEGAVNRILKQQDYLKT